MRKTIFLWSAIMVAVLTLILAFENIWLVQQYYVLFFTFNASTTIVILLGALLGFLIGFFAMLYSYEVRREKASALEADELGTSPAESVEEQSPAPEEKKEPKEELTKPDEFDDDDEVLG